MMTNRKSRDGGKGNDLITEIKSHVRHTFEDISEEFDGTRYKPWPETTSFLDDVKKGSRVLDLGSGNGRNAIYAVKKGLDVIGVDFSGNMVRLSWKKLREMREEPEGGEVEFVQCDLAGLPLKDDSVDAGFCVASLHHIPSGAARSKAVSELYRVLVPGGSALVSVWDLDQERFKEELIRQVYGVCAASAKDGSGAKGSCELPHPPAYEFGDVWVPWQSKDGSVSYRFYHLFYHDELVELLERTGFIVEKYFRRADNHNAVIKKPN